MELRQILHVTPPPPRSPQRKRDRRLPRVLSRFGILSIRRNLVQVLTSVSIPLHGRESPWPTRPDAVFLHSRPDPSGLFFLPRFLARRRRFATNLRSLRSALTVEFYKSPSTHTNRRTTRDETSLAENAARLRGGGALFLARLAGRNGAGHSGGGLHAAGRHAQGQHRGNHLRGLQLSGRADGQGRRRRGRAYEFLQSLARVHQRY